MKRFLPLIILILITLQAIAQDFAPYGRVISSVDGRPMIGVGVLASDNRHNTTTDIGGKFLFKNLPPDIDSLQFIMLGYERLVIKITENLNLGDIVLQEIPSTIEEVTITAIAPMAVQKGDTTQFNASAFKTYPDADADHLIAKMPGMVIQDGKVQAQGEDIKKVYLNGRIFFSDNVMEALKSIPADAIESIQVFDEVSDEQKETGIEDTEPTKAINIVTKNKRDTNIIVKAEGAAGFQLKDPYDFKYAGGGNMSYLGKINNITITGTANNINMSRFGDNTDPTEENLDKNGNVVGQAQGVKFTEGAGVNFSRKMEKYEISGNYLYNNVENIIEKHTNKDYYAVEDTYDSRFVRTKTDMTTYSTQHKLNLKFQYKINPNNSLTFSPSIRIQQYDYISTVYSETEQDEILKSYNYTNYDHTSSVFYLSGSATYSHRFEKPGRSMSVTSSYNINLTEYSRTQQQTETGSYSTSTELWTIKTLEDNPESLTNKLIDQETESSDLKFKVSYAEQITKKHKVVISAIANRTTGGTDKTNDDYDYTEGGYTDPNESQYNNFNRVYYSYGSGATYDFNNKNYTINTGVNILNIDQEYIQEAPLNAVTNITLLDYQPYFFLKYKLAKKMFLRIFYKGYTSLPNIADMQNVINDYSTSSLKIGNPDLETSYRNSINIYFNRTNVEKSTNLNFNLYSMVAANNITSSTELAPDILYVTDADEAAKVNGYETEEGATVTRKINMGTYVFARTNVNYSFTSKALKSNINFSVNYAYTRTPSVYYVENVSNLHTATFRAGLASNVSEKIDFNIYSATAFSKTINTSQSNSSYFNQTFYLDSNFIIAKGWVLSSDVTWRYYQDIGNYTQWNMGIGRKFFKHNNGEVRITVYDILNQDQNIQRYVWGTNIENRTTNTIGRYVLMRLSYRFNTMSMTPKKRMEGKNSKDISVDELKQMNNGAAK